jgi:multidrug resistance efflux pump
MHWMKFREKLLAGLITTGFCLAGGALLGVEEEPKSASDESPQTAKISGVLEAVVAHEISVGTEQIDSLKIKRILPHGITVSKGQNIVWFETEEIDKKIKEADIDLRLSKLTLDDDEFRYKQFLETQAIDKAAAQRTRKYAQQDYDNFVQVDRERDKLTAEYNLKSSRASLENAAEELAQLEQMYKEDDLTEESEEIVLKRAKQSVEFAQFRLEGTEIQSDRTVKQSIPRAQAQQDDSLAKAELAYQKSLRDLSSARQRQELEMTRKRDKFKEEEKKLAELKEERKRAVLTSPIDGILLHGELNRGKVADKPSTLKVGSKVTPQQVLATVVSPAKLQIRVDLQEQHLGVVTTGAKCKVKMKAFPEFESAGTVKSVSAVPYAGAKYDCVVTLRPSKQQPAILPAMTCELEFKSEQEGAEDVKGDDAKSKDEK